MKNNKGITLVALVITIIVLLILAGVSISMVVGENGVLNRAKDATDETAKAQAKEALETSISGYQGDSTVIEKISNSGYKAEAGKSFLDDLIAEGNKTADSKFKMDEEYTVKFGTATGTATRYSEATVTKNGGEWKFYVVQSGAIGAVIQDKKPTE